MANEKYQTLSEFILKPFNQQESMQRDTKFRDAYMRLRKDIHVVATTVVEKSYYIHVKIPSEAKNNDNGYDVVIRFFTDDPVIAKENHLRNYFIQFYSNSPSFMYQYAYLYNKNGYLIQMFYEKTDTSYINKAPEKRNPNMKMTYDKSIFLTCQFLSSNQYAWLAKLGHFMTKKTNVNKFLRQIPDFQAIKMDVALAAEERRLGKELQKKDLKIKEPEEDTSGTRVVPKKKIVQAIKKVVSRGKIVPKSSTGKKSTNRIIRGRKTTKR